MKEVIFKAGNYLFSCFILLSFLSWSTGLNAQCTMSCNDTIRISLDEDCHSEVMADMMLEDPQGCPGQKLVTVMDLNGNPIAGSPWVSGSQIGLYFQVKVLDISSGNSCWGLLNVEDKLPPVVTCHDITVSCGAGLSPATTGFPDASDNCDGSVALSWTDMGTTQLGCTSSNIAVLNRRWIGIDNWNNADTCFQNIYIRKASLSDVVPPHNYDDQDLPALSCSNANTDIANTGQPTVDGYPITSNCNLMVLHNDITVNLCYNAYKLVRTWTVMNNCNGQSVNFVQVIKVLDKVAPNLTCPADLTISTNNNNCYGNMLIPALPGVSDNCSDAAHITSSVISGPGTHVGNSLLNIPLGTHTITYAATDGCMNTNTCSFQVTVVDDDSPIVVCDENTVVTLLPDGTATAFALTFDDGSHDNCGIAEYKVKRMDDSGPFQPAVVFTCDDDIVTVILRVCDIHGNYNQCMVSVNVDDKESPVISCPANITLDCGDDYENPALTGTPTVVDNCSYTLTHTNDEDLNSCGEGYIVRTWTASDPSGNTADCHQSISLEDPDPFDASDITWPLDYAVYECDAPLDPDNLPAPYNRPVVNDDQCSLVAVAYDDLFFEIAEPACYKIVRTWTVVDWCQYTAQGGGIWTQNQILKVFDNTAPVITCPADMTIENQTVNCGIYVSIPPATATDCSYNLTFNYKVDKNNDGTVDYSGPGPNASGVFENGIYKIEFTVEDNCGNLDYCHFFLTVKDAKKPAVTCLFGVASNVMNVDTDGDGAPDTQMSQVWDTELIQSMSDNCTPTNQLKLRVRRAGSGTGVPTGHVVTFDCSDIGPQPVEVWVGDNANNWDYCQTFVQVQDNMNVCGTTAATAMISGGITNTVNAGVEDVSMSLVGSTMPAVMTGASGDYQFMSVPLNSTYTLTPQRDNDPLNGVTTYDIVLMTKHILGIAPLNTPYKMLAADVNRSGSITAYDLVQVRQLILGVIPEFTNNNSWRFVRSDYQFQDPANPFMEDIPEVSTLDNINQDQLINFTAFKVGDVNESASPNAWAGEEERHAPGTLQLLVPDKELQPGETVLIPFYADGDDIAAYQFTLNYDPAKISFVESRAGLLGVEESNFGVFEDKGALTSSWNTTAVPATGNISSSAAEAAGTDTPWFYLVFKANEVTHLSEVLTLNSRITTAVAYDGAGTELNVALVFETERGAPAENDVFELYQNEPNPFLNRTTIGFHLPYNTPATIRLFDANGRMIREMNGQYTKGYHEISFEKELFPAEGIYFYQLETSEFTATKKMVVIN